MRVDNQGHFLWTPREFYARVQSGAERVINDYLLGGTPVAFPSYSAYCEFLAAVSHRIGVHPRALFIRGSCHVGFSIAPRPKVWTSISDASDIDLAVVDVDYFSQINDEVQRWERGNRPEDLTGKAARDFANRQQDRFYNCCRDASLPQVVCVHHLDSMRRVSAETARLCGTLRHVSAFIFRDWWSVRRRYEYDLRKLCEGVQAGRLPPPDDQPFLNPRTPPTGDIAP